MSLPPPSPYYGTTGDAAPSAETWPAIAAMNPIHNGGFTIWQRGTSFASPTNGTYGPDRWSYVVTGTTAVNDMILSTDVPAVAALVPLTSYSGVLHCTTADAAVAAGDLVSFRQVIEGYNFQPFAQKQFTLGFWVFATKTGTYCVSFKNSGVDRSYIGEYTINATNTWEYKTVTVPASPSAGTWNYANGVGLYLDFTLMAGSTHQTTTGTWQTGHYYGTASQVNACDTIGNYFALWGVTMGLGAAVAPFWPRSFGAELALCQRYYQQIPGSVNARYASGFCVSATSADVVLSLPVSMRAGPTVSFGSAANYQIYTGAGSLIACTALTAVVSATDRFGITTTVAGGQTAGQGALFLAVNTSASIAISADL